MCGQLLGGEYYLADALQTMISSGSCFRTAPTPLWADCGTIDAVLDTNAALLARGHDRLPTPLPAGVTIVSPVYIDPTAQLETSTIGPNVSIGPGATVRGSTLRDALVLGDATIENSSLEHSLIGASAHVEGYRGRLNISDFSEVSAG